MKEQRAGSGQAGQPSARAALLPADAPQPDEHLVTRGGLVVTGAGIAWTLAAALFVLLRVGLTWQAPVGGAELLHLSGAWQASIGVADERYVPTLFQAVSALLFEAGSSEVPARVVAFLATATIPAAVYLLRGRLGEAGALIALVLLAIDPVNIALGVPASAMGFDLAIALWLLVALDRPGLPAWAWLVAGFAVASAGPIPLTLAGAALGVTLWRRDAALSRAFIFALPGAVVAVALTTALRYALGDDNGSFVIPPFQLLADGYEQTWSTGTAGEILVLYGLPLAAGGAVALALGLRRCWRATDREPFTLVLLAWAGLSAAWLFSGLGAHSWVPVAGLLLPLALLLGPLLAEGIEAMARASWRLAALLLPAAAVALAIAMAYVFEWAKVEKVDPDERVAVALLVMGAAGALAVLASSRRTTAPLLAAALVAAAFPALAGTLGVGLSGYVEPVPSPRSPGQARQLRDTALQAVAEKGGAIVIHPRYEQELTWPFRDSGKLVVASRVPPEATVVLWPPELAPPAGFTKLEGIWRLSESIEPPTGSLLRYLHWYVDRNRLEIKPEPMAVYSKAEQ